MTGTVALAAYGALIGTASFGWRAWEWWHEQRTKISVDMQGGLLPDDPFGGNHLTVLHVQNRCAHDVKVEAVEVVLPPPQEVMIPVHDGVSFVVLVREVHGLTIDLDELAGRLVGKVDRDLRGPIYARLRTSDYHCYSTKPAVCWLEIPKPDA
jgi:hypothetical protein